MGSGTGITISAVPPSPSINIINTDHPGIDARRIVLHDPFKFYGESVVESINNPCKEIEEELPMTTEQTGKPCLIVTELQVVLPLLGQRVMIKPEYQSTYDSSYRTETGTIIGLRGGVSDAGRIARQYVQTGRAEGWQVRVRFDNGKDRDINIERMLPVHGIDSTLHEIHFTTGDTYYWTQDDYDKKLDEYVIRHQYEVHKHTKWNNDKRQETVDKALERL